MLQEQTTPRRALRDRLPRRGDERELALLATAERRLTDGTWGAGTLAEIAREAGVSRSGFYFYFASKDALLSTLILRTLDQLADGLPALSSGDDSGAPTAVSAAAALRAALRSAADLWFDHRAVLMAATELGAREPLIFDRVVVAQARLVELTAALLAQGTRVSSDAQARTMAEMFTWMAERNFYVRSREEPSRASLHELADRLHETWLAAAGLQPDDQGIAAQG